jgi:hypothetical protein
MARSTTLFSPDPDEHIDTNPKEQYPDPALVFFQTKPNILQPIIESEQFPIPVDKNKSHFHTP